MSGHRPQHRRIPQPALEPQKPKPKPKSSKVEGREAVPVEGESSQPNGHANGRVHKGGVGAQRPSAPEQAPDDVCQPISSTVTSPSHRMNGRHSGPSPESSISSPAPKTIRPRHQSKDVDTGMERPAPCSVPLTAPLSEKGEAYASSSRRTYPELFQLLKSFSPLDFTGQQVVYEAQLASTRSNQQRVRSLVQKAALLLYWESHTERDTEKFFQGAQNPSGAQYKDLIVRCKDIGDLITSEMDSSHTSKREARQSQIKTSAEAFFTLGTVFAFAEEKRSRHSDITDTRTIIRRMIVIKVDRSEALCLPISTYGGRGVPGSPTGAIDQDHAILFRSGAPVPSRLRQYGEAMMSKKPIAVDLEPGETLDRSCRICFHRPQVIKHNIRVARIWRTAEVTKQIAA